MVDVSENDTTKYWRDKYLDLLDDHDKLKKSADTSQEQMRRGLVMVSLLAEGQAADLDTSLRSLRETLKSGTSMHSVLDNLGRSVRTFEDQNAARAEVLLGQISDAALKLSNCPLPKPLLKRVKSVRQNAEQQLHDWSGYFDQLQSWLQVIGELATLDGYEQERQSSWWQRWFKPASAENSTDIELITAGAVVNTVTAASVNSTQQEPGFSHIAADVAESLQNLLSQIVVPERLKDTWNELQQRLQKGLYWFELVPLLEDTTTFILQCLSNSQVELEQFLINLDQRLQTIQRLVTETGKSQEESQSARTELDHMVRGQLADIRSVITGQNDLGDLGLSVSEHLSLILQAMDKFQREESEREKVLSARLAQLQQRLLEMEKEVNDSRLALEETKRRATLDSLTGLPNREAYNKRLESEMARFNRYGSALSIVVGDVDLFKRINDTYGHLAGDKVLQIIAKTLQSNLRDIDFIARYGGEEFVILMPETDAEAARLAAEKLRQKIEQSPFNFRKERVPITISFGISQFQANERAETVFERADKALYQAKESGRNRSIIG